MYGFLRYVPDVDKAIEIFWRQNAHFLQEWYQKKRRADDVIISASPEFLLAPMAKKLGVHLIASRVDSHTGVYDGVNCHGEEKVRRFRAEFGETQVEEFYSDSLSDTPMARVAREAFLVKGETITPWPFQ